MNVGPVLRDDASATYFDGTARGQLLLQRCPEGHVSGPQATGCETCGAPDLAVEPASGSGVLVTWSTVPGADGDDVVLAVVELAEGPWLWTRVRSVEHTDELRAGRPVTVGFASADADHESVVVVDLV